MSYAETPCTGRLGELIESEWSLETTATGFLVHPDGCADLLFDESGRIWLSGLIRSSQVWNPQWGPTLRGLRLRPGAIPFFFGIPASALVNEVASVVDLPSPLARALGARVKLADTRDELVGDTLRLLRRASSARSVEPRISAALPQLAWKSLPAIASSLGMAERHLRRLFVDEVGVGPSRLKRIYRLQRTIDAMRHTRTADISLAAFALDQGFSDQAHMNHDVKELTGLTPYALFRSVTRQ